MGTLNVALVCPEATATIRAPSSSAARKSLPAASATLTSTASPAEGAAVDSVSVNARRRALGYLSAAGDGDVGGHGALASLVTLTVTEAVTPVITAARGREVQLR